MTSELREMIDARKRELAATWAEPDVRFGRYAGDAATDPIFPVVHVPVQEPAQELPHGLSRYTHKGCRCAVCSQAVREYKRKRRAKAAEGKTQGQRGRRGSVECPKNAGGHRWRRSGSDEYGPLMNCGHCHSTRKAVPSVMVRGRRS